MHAYHIALIASLCLCAAACGGLDKETDSRPDSQPQLGASDHDSRHPEACHGHYDGPFRLDGGGVAPTPGPGIVFGTADFSDLGHVLIKFQIEDLTVIGGNQARVTAWHGDGPPPVNAGVIPPPGGTQFYETTSDVDLRHWTTHIDRNYDEALDEYWVFVRVDHAGSSPSAPRDVRYLWYSWQPSTAARPDSPHNFNGYETP